MKNIINVRYYNSSYGFREKEYEFEISDTINEYLDKLCKNIGNDCCYLGFFDSSNEFKQVQIMQQRKEPNHYLPECGYIVQLADCIITHYSLTDCLAKGKTFGNFKDKFLQSNYADQFFCIFNYTSFKHIKFEDENNKENLKKIGVRFVREDKTLSDRVYYYLISPYLYNQIGTGQQMKIYVKGNTYGHRWYHNSNVKVCSINDYDADRDKGLIELSGIYKRFLNGAGSFIANHKEDLYDMFYEADMSRFFHKAISPVSKGKIAKYLRERFNVDFSKTNAPINIFFDRDGNLTKLNGEIRINFCANELKDIPICHYYTDDSWESVDSLVSEVDDRLSALADSFKILGESSVYTTNSLTDCISTFVDKYHNNNNNNNNKGEKSMNLFKNLNVGKYTKSNVAYSVKGMAYKTVDGQYVAYCDGELIDVTSLLLDIGDMFVAIPVAYNSIKAGDVILHNSRPVIVAGEPSTEAPYSIPVVYPETKETRNIIPEKNIFNFNFVVKIVNPMEDMLQNTNADASNPFGNLLPFMLMSEGKNDFKDIMLISMLNGNTLDANPLVLYSLMNENGNDDFMKFMLLSQMSPSTFNFSLNGAPADNVSNS